MRRLVFIISLCVCFALSANGAGAENIARGVRVIVIDAGHGGPKFPGAHYRGIYEKDLNLKVALKLGALIERELPEVKVVYTRKTDKQFSESLTKDLQARADIANKAEGEAAEQPMAAWEKARSNSASTTRCSSPTTRRSSST